METNRHDPQAALALGFELGKTYRNDYWGQNHTITQAWMNNGWPVVRSLWADGRTTTHSTARGKRDQEIA